MLRHSYHNKRLNASSYLQFLDGKSHHIQHTNSNGTIMYVANSNSPYHTWCTVLLLVQIPKYQMKQLAQKMAMSIISCMHEASEGLKTGFFYGDDPLWDGAGCGPQNTCCSFNTPPWFYRQPPLDDIEMRLYRNQIRNDWRCSHWSYGIHTWTLYTTAITRDRK